MPPGSAASGGWGFTLTVVLSIAIMLIVCRVLYPCIASRGVEDGHYIRNVISGVAG